MLVGFIYFFHQFWYGFFKYGSLGLHSGQGYILDQKNFILFCLMRIMDFLFFSWCCVMLALLVPFNYLCIIFFLSVEQHSHTIETQVFWCIFVSSLGNIMVLIMSYVTQLAPLCYDFALGVMF